MVTIATTLGFCLVAAGTSASSDALNHKVDLVEVNHCYDEKGQLVFDQLLFYDWCPTKSHYDVRDWCLLKSPLQVPRRNQDTGGYLIVWRDASVLHKVYAETLRETWTQYDPEILEQQSLPKERRRSFPKLAARRPPTRPSASQAPIRTGTAPVQRR